MTASILTYHFCFLFIYKSEGSYIISKLSILRGGFFIYLKYLHKYQFYVVKTSARYADLRE